MIIKYLKKTGEVVASFPETKYLPPNDQIGKVEVFEEGKKKYGENNLETVILEGELPTEYQNPKNGLLAGDLVVKKIKDGLKLKDKKTKKKFNGERVVRYYTKSSSSK